MNRSLIQRLGTGAQGRAVRFLLVQLAHTTITIVALAALVLGAARAGALSGLVAPAATNAGTSFTTINYQGRLADSSGSPIDNTNPGVGMTFALYEADSGGSPVWSETHANVPVSNGLFSVRLGSVNVLSTDHLTGDRWLGIQVGTDSEMTPREKLAAVPYAMQAAWALTVSDEAINGNHLANSGFGISNQPLLSFVPTSAQQVLRLDNQSDIALTDLDLTDYTSSTATNVLIWAQIYDKAGTATAAFYSDGVSQFYFRNFSTTAWMHNQIILPLNSDQLIQYQLNASGSDTASLDIRVIGYWEPAHTP